MNKLSACLSALAFIGLLSAPSAYADYDGGQNTANLNIKLTVKEGCNFDSTGENKDITFPKFTRLDHDLTQQGNFTLTCTEESGGQKGWQLKLDNGSLGQTGATSDRCLYLDKDIGKPCLKFQVYQGESGNKIWGQTGDDIYKLEAIRAGGGSVPVPFHVVLPQQKLDGFTAGEYSNVLTVTLEHQD